MKEPTTPGSAPSTRRPRATALADHDGTRWAVAAIGVTLLLSSTVSLRATSPDTAHLEFLVTSIHALLIVAIGIGLARSTIDTRHVHVAAIWTVVGAIALVGTGSYTIGMYGLPADKAQALIGFDLTTGGLGGSLVGAVSARSRQRAAALDDERDRLAFLNYLLRHNVLNGVQVVRSQTDRLRDDADTDVDRHVDVIDAWTTGLADLVGRIRHFLDASTGHADLDAIPLGTVLDAEVRKVEGAFDADIATTGTTPSVVADDGLHQVFECVLVDAVARTDDPNPNITVTTATCGPDVVVEVTTPNPVAASDDPTLDSAPTHDPNDLGFGRHLVATLVDYYGGTVAAGDRDDDVLYSIHLPHAEP